MKNKKEPITPNRKDLSCFFKKTNRMFSTYASYYPGSLLDGTDKAKRRIFIDNKAPVLFVAHLDTVCKPHFKGLKKGDSDQINAAGLDDRLGVYAIDLLVNQFGVNADILLTDLEETGQTTAAHHECKNYNWIAEFDRRGDDVVTYGLSCEEFDKALLEHFEIGFGSFSDISAIKSKACAVNVGIGYYNAHSPASFFSIKEFATQLTKFREFYNQHVGTMFKRDILKHYHKERFPAWDGGRFGNVGFEYQSNYPINMYDDLDYYNDPRFDKYEIETPTSKNKFTKKRPCDFCGAEETERVFSEYDICENCFEYMVEESGISAFKGYNI